MSNTQKIFEYKDESQADRLTRKSKDSPFMIIGQCKTKIPDKLKCPPVFDKYLLLVLFYISLLKIYM